MGLFSFFITILGGISFADKNNFIPVVDMKNYKNSYLYDNELHQVNVWEYYFEQPGNIPLETALSCQKYILGKDTGLHEWPPQTAEFFYNKNGALDYWRGLCKKYIRFKPAVLEKLKELQEKTKGKKILGVSIRGTDYVAMKPHGHPIQPTPEQVIEKVHDALHEKNFDAVYLTTEDKKILAKFQTAFGEKLITLNRDYINFDYDDDKWIMAYVAERKNDRYLRGLEYLVSMLFLTKCQGLITSMTSGSSGVMCLSEGFEYLYVFDLGVYE